MTNETTIGRGKPPKKWAFLRDLKVDHFAEVSDLSAYSALRTAASRAGTRLKRKFSVSREMKALPQGGSVEVIRVYRTK